MRSQRTHASRLAAEAAQIRARGHLRPLCPYAMRSHTQRNAGLRALADDDGLARESEDEQGFGWVVSTAMTEWALAVRAVPHPAGARFNSLLASCIHLTIDGKVSPVSTVVLAHRERSDGSCGHSPLGIDPSCTGRGGTS